MTLTSNEFLALRTLALQGSFASQRALSAASGIPLSTLNGVVRRLERDELVLAGKITDAGRQALEPYRVDNAVIMAAGMSERFAPISYEKPKGLLRVRGEVLIERQIRQLQEAGIRDITVVVGYKAEYFYYLRHAFGVDIVVNPEFSVRNNNSTLWRVRERLANTYVCSSDDYFTENPFERYVHEAYYASAYVAGPTDEWCLTTGPGHVIRSVTVGGRDSWVMLGHVYFDRAFSATFRRILDAEYELPETAPKLWEALYAEHIDELRMTLRKYPDGFIHEFDSLDELRSFDPDFLDNVDSSVLDNIAASLGCTRHDITDIYPLKQGLTNLSCHFTVHGEEYVYRHPGAGTSDTIDRAAELDALRQARDLDLDSTFLTGDPANGWKISRFVPDAKCLDPHDAAQLRAAMTMSRRLHTSDVEMRGSFDYLTEALRYEERLTASGPIDVPGYAELRAAIVRLHEHAERDAYPRRPSHNDFYHLNFLRESNGTLHLIDWEYAGMSDVASDFGTFALCAELSDTETFQALTNYLDHPPTYAQWRHFVAYIALAGWFWYVWGLDKEQQGESVGEWLYVYYRGAADNVDRALAWYEGPQPGDADAELAQPPADSVVAS